MFILGTAIAAAVSLLSPAAQNIPFWYLVACGVVSICSMILPGISGSFVLILMGNYELIVIDAINALNWRILFPWPCAPSSGWWPFPFPVLDFPQIPRRNDRRADRLHSGVPAHPLALEDGRLATGHGRRRRRSEQGKSWWRLHVFLPPLNEEFWWALAVMAAIVLTIWVTEKLAVRNDSP